MNAWDCGNSFVRLKIMEVVSFSCSLEFYGFQCFFWQGKDVWNLKPEAVDIFIKSGKCSSRLEEHQKAQLGELEIRITLNQTSCLTLMFFLFYLDGHRKHALSLHNVHLRIWPEIDKNIKIHRGNCPCFISLTIIIIITTIKGSNHDDHDHHHNDYHLSSAALNNWTIFLVASISAVAFSVTPPHRLRRFQWFYNNERSWLNNCSWIIMIIRPWLNGHAMMIISIKVITILWILCE